ncbi:MAG: AAA family ATPase [Alphaproteobacteria bacterium]
MAMSPPYLRSIHIPPQQGNQNFPLNTLMAAKGIDLLCKAPITIICGENGSGKSTLLEALAINCGFSVLGGGRNNILMDQTSDVTPLAEATKLVWNKKTPHGFFMRAESFHQFSTHIDELAEASGLALAPYGCKSLHEQSHGESFISLFSNRFGKGLFILDEPESALSPQRQLELMIIINDLAATGESQFIMATHSPLLMALPNSQFLLLDDGVFTEAVYHQSRHFKVMARFFANPETYVKQVLDN